ncbi:uroporphyrinogen III synthase [Haloprofundus marisrubri]|uniref:Uroporphyrinogen III synthase n=1 Tax=Haloprofundus marisrubri TaxID=1514971 RepID=A0A0W1R488_9EURY|nr:uroporphyrinogen-III synthase [Haloprofundus marisrubri]KTG07917.1 uroporphyrinogen III synthase [Haloprofundus marisrubri]
MSQEVRVAVFRPNDERLQNAIELLDSLGATPVDDPMLAVEPTGQKPREDAEYAILTSKTGVELVADAGWTPEETTLCAIGDSTAAVMRDHGFSVDIVPDEFSSTGLVETLRDRVPGARVEVARSDHGSPVLTDGLEAAGSYVHETVLYRLVRPPESGKSAEMAAKGELEAALFTSSLTVGHFLDAAAERGVRDEAIAGLNDAVVGAIGDPTRETAEAQGIDVDVVPDAADFEELACAAVEAAAPTYHE